MIERYNRREVKTQHLSIYLSIHQNTVPMHIRDVVNKHYKRLINKIRGCHCEGMT